jgi:chorismate synthase
LLIPNTDQRPENYDRLKNCFRPGHADYTFQMKYGLRDYRGGGRASARETVSRVAGGAIAQAFLRGCGISIAACTVEYGGIVAPLTDIENAHRRSFFAPDDGVVERWEALAMESRAAQDSLGGIVHLEAAGVPVGLGEPVFDKLDARIGAAMFGVGAVKGVEIGTGFKAARMRGSEHNDRPQSMQGGRLKFASNNAGGVLGGISTGESLQVKVSVKPIPSIGLVQKTFTDAGMATEISLEGRHDLCAIPRIVPVLKAMLALTLADFILLRRTNRV